MLLLNYNAAKVQKKKQSRLLIPRISHHLTLLEKDISQIVGKPPIIRTKGPPERWLANSLR